MSDEEDGPDIPPGMEKLELKTGVIIVHGKQMCSGQCPIHNPSDHHMREWRLHWRDDRRIFERICPHGIGHPDPDTLAFIEKTLGKEACEEEGRHGCDNCCKDPRDLN